MKANKAPEKIYLQVCGDCNANDCENCNFEDIEDDITWCKDRIFPKDVEYTRTDAFVEKAVKWLESNLQGIAGGSIYIGDFRNYMKGEDV